VEVVLIPKPMWDELLRRIDRERSYAQAYADDGLVLVKQKFLGVVCERMQMACKDNREMVH